MKVKFKGWDWPIPGIRRRTVLMWCCCYRTDHRSWPFLPNCSCCRNGRRSSSSPHRRHLSVATPHHHQQSVKDYDSAVSHNVLIGPILWGHSGPLCHAMSLLSLSWTSMCRRRATVATPSEWQCKIRRRAAARSGEWAQHFSNASCWSISDFRGLLRQPVASSSSVDLPLSSSVIPLRSNYHWLKPVRFTYRSHWTLFSFSWIHELLPSPFIHSTSALANLPVAVEGTSVRPETWTGSSLSVYDVGISVRFDEVPHFWRRI